MNGVGLVISKDFRTWDPGLMPQELLCSRVLLKYEKGERKLLDPDIRRGTQSAHLASLSKALYAFIRPTPTTYILR